MKCSISLIIISLALVTSGCSKSIHYDVASALSKSEDVMNKYDMVQIVASSFDGDETIKLRILVKQQINNAQAKNLMTKYIDEINKNSHSKVSEPFFDRYLVRFNIIDGKIGTELYKGIKEKGNKEIYWIF
jgi:hypothetical protein